MLGIKQTYYKRRSLPKKLYNQNKRDEWGGGGKRFHISKVIRMTNGKYYVSSLVFGVGYICFVFILFFNFMLIICGVSRGGVRDELIANGKRNRNKGEGNIGKTRGQRN